MRGIKALALRWRKPNPPVFGRVVTARFHHNGDGQREATSCTYVWSCEYMVSPCRSYHIRTVLVCPIHSARQTRRQRSRMLLPVTRHAVPGHRAHCTVLARCFARQRPRDGSNQLGVRKLSANISIKTFKPTS